MIAKRGKIGVTGRYCENDRRNARYGAAAPGRVWSIVLGVAVAAVLGLSLSSVAIAAQSSSSSSSSSKSVGAQRSGQASYRPTAKEDVDVGTFYMHKGDYGAAISRFESAVKRDPHDGKARLLLAESYDKQGNKTAALKNYEAYLSDFPNARDDKKIQKKVEELSRKRD